MAKDMMGYGATTVPQGSRVVLIVSSGPTQAGGTSYVAMPDVIGKSQGVALEDISKSSLQAQVVYDYHPFNKKGSVTATRPAPHANALAGSDTLVLVSSGEPMGPRPIATLPLVVGMTENEAVQQMRDAGLSVQVMYEPSASVPAGHVIDQLPDRATYSQKEKRGGRAKWWVIAALLVSLLLAGIAAGAYFGLFSREKIEVPDVVGMLEEDAVAVMEEAGFVVGDITDQDPTAEFSIPGTVLAQDPEAGKKAAKGSKVNLDVVLDPLKERAAIPSVIGKSAEEAVTTLQAAGFFVNQEYIATSAQTAGIVAEQSPVAGTKAIKESTVTIRISTGAAVDIVVPDLVGLNEAAALSLLGNVGLTWSLSSSQSDVVPAGSVISSSPASGTSVAAGTNVALVISEGMPVDTRITLKDYTGWNSLEAQKDLAALGLVGTLNPSGADGAVISTAPAAGTAVEKGSTVTLNVGE